MQYELTEEQVWLQTTVRRLAKEKVSPGAASRDESEEFDWDMVELLPKMASMELTSPKSTEAATPECWLFAWR